MMKVAYVMFDGMTTLDWAGVHEVLPWMLVLGAKPDLSWDFCSNKDRITDDRGLKINIDHVLPDLSRYDLVFVTGGMPTRQLRFDAAFMAWIKTARDAKLKASVCTGALLLGAAGFLEGKRATTNPSAYDLLAPYCAEVVRERCVRDGDVFTGGAASSSIDLGLLLVESLTDVAFARQVQQKIDYPYYRPQL
ncbi:DJ-1/PfpI family protein [Cohnella yongneupensis]|uniref:DJ-1/PfpI family protein n=1 Tax=Cohnella yongneupensis TaxID=425006 RepID=A0ABW0QV51_9BACL